MLPTGERKGTRGVDIPQWEDASWCGRGTFCIDAETETEHNRGLHLMLIVDCPASAWQYSPVAPMLWIVDGHSANVTCVRGMLEGGRDHPRVTISMNLPGSTNWTRLMLSVTSASQQLLITSAIFNWSYYLQPDVRSEEALLTLPSNSERGLCSRVNKHLILKLLCENNIIVDYNKCERHCWWINVSFL